MRKLFALLLICLCLIAGAAAETIELTGEVSAKVRLGGVTEDLTIILRDATLQDGLFVECAQDTTVTLKLFGDNVINSTTALDRSILYTPDSVITVRMGNLNIISGEENASLKVNQHFITTDRENLAIIVPPAIRAERGSVTIAANNVIVQGGDLDCVTPAQDQSIEGDELLQPRSSHPFVIGGVVMADGDVVISGDHVHILGGIFRSHRYVTGAVPGFAVVSGVSDPELWMGTPGTITISGDDVLCRSYYVVKDEYTHLVTAALAGKDFYMVGSPEGPMTVRASEQDSEWFVVEGSPFTAKVPMTWEYSDEDWDGYNVPFQVHTQITRTTPTPTPTAAPAVPQTGDGSDIILWLGVVTLAMIAAVLVWKPRRA